MRKRIEIVGEPTELCLRLRTRTDKPHFCIRKCTLPFMLGEPAYFLGLWHEATFKTNPDIQDCVTAGFYKTPGEAARAWHDYKAD